MSLAHVVRVANESTAEIRSRLSALCVDEPGGCLLTAALAAAVLKRRGLAAVVQAGTVAWRRVEEQEGIRRGEQNVECFSYEWSPDTDFSRRIMRDGKMPEFHSWVGIVGDFPGGGVIVDYSAHHFPTVVENSHKDFAMSDGRMRMANGEQYECAVESLYPPLTWDTPRPNCPEIVTAAECNQRSPLGSVVKCVYVVDPEATLFVLVRTRGALIKLEVDGETIGSDVWSVIPGRPQRITPAVLMTAFDSPERSLDFVRSKLKELVA